MASLLMMTMTLAGGSIAGATSTKMVGGTIHVYDIQNMTSPTQDVIVTGVFADSGTLVFKANPSKLAMKNGSILINVAKGAAAENKFFSQLATHVNPTTCALVGSFSSSYALQSGTGAYAGISGAVTLTSQEIGIFPRLASGKCNLSSSASPTGFIVVIEGSGLVSFK